MGLHRCALDRCALKRLECAFLQEDALQQTDYNTGKDFPGYAALSSAEQLLIRCPVTSRLSETAEGAPTILPYERQAEL